MGAVANLFPAYTEADWGKAAEAALKGASLETLVSKTADGVRIEPVYPPAEGPRAIRPGGPWRVIARLDHPDAGEANAQALDDLANGADGLQVVFASALGAYGFGLERSDSGALHKAFDGIRLDAEASFELDLGPDGPAQAAAFAGLVERSGARPGDCRVAFGLDPFALSARGPFPADWSAQAASYVETALALRSRGFRGPFFVADARAAHAAGGSPAQDLAFALAAAVSLLRLLEETGTPLGEARALIAFRLAADADELATIAKFRALRILWSRVEEACGLEPRAAYLQAESAWRMMTARNVYLNVMRGVSGAVSAGLGGADSFSILPHTLAAGFPDSLARRLARNAQLVLLRESNLGFVADPAAGAGAYEALTDALCREGWRLFQKIEGHGGLPRALAKGAFQQEVAASAAALAGNIACLKTPITGVSVRADLAEPAVEFAVGAPEREKFAPAAGALAPIRLAEPFERLRDLSDAMLARAGARPKVYLAALGSEAHHRHRVEFMCEWLAAGGFEAVHERESATPEGARARLGASGADLVCLCGPDDAYAEQAESLAKAFKAAGAKGVALAGRPGRFEPAWRAAGVDAFIFAGVDAVATLRSLYGRIGIETTAQGAMAS
ncbi:MAG TPA: methylmalonyl-CoA mutase family protein [Roseiarcus sp.]|nr:methylmalonyl-CoA mutase family protein [Roseiarcus sp.]